MDIDGKKLRVGFQDLTIELKDADLARGARRRWPLAPSEEAVATLHHSYYY